MNCARHPDREATLAVDLPSIGVQVHWCEECKAAYNAKWTGPYKVAPWDAPDGAEARAEEREQRQGLYAYRSVGIGGTRNGEVQWLHPSQRKR